MMSTVDGQELVVEVVVLVQKVILQVIIQKILDKEQELHTVVMVVLVKHLI